MHKMGYCPLTNSATPGPWNRLFRNARMATGRLSDVCVGIHTADRVPEAVGLCLTVELLVGKRSHSPERRAPFSCVQSLGLVVSSPPVCPWYLFPPPLLVPALPGHAGGCSPLPQPLVWNRSSLGLHVPKPSAALALLLIGLSTANEQRNRAGGSPNSPSSFVCL